MHETSFQTEPCDTAVVGRPDGRVVWKVWAGVAS
jgi:hypothetical protein